MSDRPQCTFCDTELQSGSFCSTCGARMVEQDGKPLWFKNEAREQEPDAPPAKKPMSALGCFGWLALIAVVIGLVASAGSDDEGGGGGGDSFDEQSFAAFDVCRDFVTRRLKSPGTAKFRNFHQDDGEVVVTGSGAGPYVVRSTVDSENGFGALIRSSFTCTVNHVGGENWRLADLDLVDGG